jgi:hypothetical protein
VTDKQGLNSITWSTLPGTYVAAKQSYLSEEDARQVNAFAWYAKKHQELVKMRPDDARNAFGKLEQIHKDSLRQLFDDTDYGAEDKKENSFFKKISKVITSPVGAVFDFALDYTETVISNPFRQADAVVRGEGFNWDDRYDGNAYFDQERSDKIQRHYGNSVAKIAKQASAGRTPGEILLTLQGEEEFDAFEKFYSGEQVFKDAIADYEDAKVSFGRRAFGFIAPNPGETGARRFLYDRLSGAADLGYQIIADPITYMTFGIGTGVRIGGVQVLKGARSIMKLLEDTQNVVIDGKMMINPTAMDKIFANKGVREYWDRLGKLINSDDTADFQKLNEEFRDLTPALRKELRAGGVKDADSAKSFFSYAEHTEKLLQGNRAPDRVVMPVWNAQREIKNKVRAATVSVIHGKPVTGATVPDEDTLIKSLIATGKEEDLYNGRSITQEIANEQKRRSKFGRLLERYPMSPVVQIGDRAADSGDLVYQMARLADLPRYHANAVRKAFEDATVDERLLLLRGLYTQVGQSLGLNRTEDGAKWLNDELTRQFTGLYAVPQRLSDNTLNALEDVLPVDNIRARNNSYTAGENNKTNLAPLRTQTRMTIAIPNFDEWRKTARKFEGGVSALVGSSGYLAQNVNNKWGFLTLFPRNGMRSGIDELIFYGLEATTREFLNFFKGRAASRAFRRTKNVKEQTLTQRLGWIIAKSAKDYDEQKIVDAINEGPRAYHRLLVEQTAEEYKGRKLTDADKEYLIDLLDTGSMSEFSQYLATGVTAGSMVNAAAISRTAPGKVLGDSQYGHDAVLRIGKEQAIKEELLVVRAKDDTPREIARALPNQVGHNEFMAAWFGSLFNFMTSDQKSALIILKNLSDGDNTKRAVDELVAYVKKDKRAMKQVEAMVNYDGTEASLRKIMADEYLYYRNLLTDPDDILNVQLVNKLYDTNTGKLADVTGDDFMPSDLRKIFDENGIMPISVHGYGYTTIPNGITDGEMLSFMIEAGYSYMDKQLLTMAREPIFISRFLANRQGLAKAEANEVAKRIAAGERPEIAKAITRDKYASIAAKNAFERTIAFVDNPNARTHLAFHLRNFARFYRATEDFYRRSVRLGSNPENLARLRLSLVGLDASGFIHEDEQGDEYFIFPADDIIYTAVNTVSKAFGRQDALDVMPIEFGTKISMLTPSLDPDSALPSFAGPVAALPISAIRNIMGKTDIVPGEAERIFNRYTLGVYSENSNLLDMITPTFVRRGLRLAGVGADREIASAAMAAAAYVASAGYAPEDGDDFNTFEKKKAIFLATAANIVTIRNLVGAFAPAGLNVMETKDIPRYILETDTTRMSSEFYKIADGLKKQGSLDPYGEAIAIWTKKNPGRLAYTVPRTENVGTVKLAKTKDAANWVRNNTNLVQKYGNAAVLFAPQIGEFDIGAYNYLKLNGFTQVRPIDDFLKDMQTEQVYKQYNARKDYWNELIDDTTDDSARSYYRQKKETELRMLRESSPLLEERLSSFVMNVSTQIATMEDLRTMIDSGDAPTPGLARRLREMIDVVDKARDVWSRSNGADFLPPERIANIKTDVMVQLNRIAGDDLNLQLAIQKIFEPIVERSR